MNKPSYYQQHRSEILPLIRATPSRVLDIGCGKGGVASTLRHHFESLSITGFDKYRDDAFDYSSAFNAFHNVDLMEEWPSIDYASFDLVLLLDVLEHLTEPQTVLRKLSTLISSETQVIVSLPNFHFYSNLYEIIRSGRFQYKDSGILDRTHVRFFGFEDAREMINEHFDVVTHIPFQLHKTTTGKLVELTLGSKYAAYQNVFLCKPKAR
jgi:2-polyprenyl-3-methyl-5-hydroxy-6-metoxy-1,4-benzoquinol methylase